MNSYVVISIDNLYIDQKDNLYIQTLNSTSNKRELFILKYGNTIAIEITGYKNDGNFFQYLSFTKNNDCYFISRENLQGKWKLYKVNAGTTTSIEITGYSGFGYNQKLLMDLTIDNNNNVYFTGRNEDNSLSIYKISNNSIVAKEIYKNSNNNFNDVVLNIDNKNNLYLSFRNKDNSLSIYKISKNKNPVEIIKSKLLSFFQIDFVIDKFENINIFIFSQENLNNFIEINKNNNVIDFLENIWQINDGVYSLKNDVLNCNLSSEKGLFTFEFCSNVIPSKPMPTGEIIVIVASSLIGLGILGFGGYFIYYDRKHHVVKKWWEKRKGGK